MTESQYIPPVQTPVSDYLRPALIGGVNNGWAAANFNCHPRRAITFKVPEGLSAADSSPAPRRVTLEPHQGVIYRRG